MTHDIRPGDYVNVPSRPEMGKGTVARVLGAEADVYTARMRGQTEPVALALLSLIHRNVTE
jgi:hypothetical protein